MRLGLLLGEDAQRITAGTFHALCARWLRADGSLVGIPPWASVFDEVDAVKVMGQALHDCGVPTNRVEPTRALGRISWAKSRLLTVERFAAAAEGPSGTELDRLLVPVYARYQALLEAQAGLDFDDLILRTILLFHQHPAVLARYQARFRHVLVDEFQDTSTSEFQLLHQLTRARPEGFTAVFDDDQAIFAWREADVRNIARAARLARATVVQLDQNYRSQATIVAAAAGVIARNVGRTPKAVWTANPPGAPIYLHAALSDVAEAAFVASTIRQLHGQRGLPFRACAVLFRANAQSHKLETAFLKAGIP
jgi:DNA helicase-2/ATP-dependent DNA helicase PcrA